MGLDDVGPDAEQNARVARIGRRLSFLGFVPLAALALWIYGSAADHPWREEAIALLATYGVATLSFLGGIRWGMAVPGHSGSRDLLLSVAPPLVGWAALLTAPPLVFVLLAVAFAAQGAWDSLTLPAGWFRRTRVQLTMLEVAGLIVAFVATS